MCAPSFLTLRCALQHTSPYAACGTHEKLSTNPSASKRMSFAADQKRENKKKMLTFNNCQPGFPSFFSIKRSDREVVTRRERLGADSNNSLVKYFDR
jgi:hypothetical protein